MIQANVFKNTKQKPKMMTGKFEFDCPVHGCANIVSEFSELCDDCEQEYTLQISICTITNCTNNSMRSTWKESEVGLGYGEGLIHAFLQYSNQAREDFHEFSSYYDPSLGDYYPGGVIFQTSKESKLWKIFGADLGSWELDRLEGEMCRSCFEERFEKVRVTILRSRGHQSKEWVWAPKDSNNPRTKRRRRNFGEVRARWSKEHAPKFGG